MAHLDDGMELKQDCRYFSGYKPCQFKRSCHQCPHYKVASHRIIIVSLEALGAVLRSTCLLGPLRRRYPEAHITWLTMPNAKALLLNNPMIDRVLTHDVASLPILDRLEFDFCFTIDKSMLAGALAHRIQAAQKFGFGINAHGAIVPLNEEAQYQYEVGLDDHLKFFENQKPETQQITETMGLEWQRDPYVLEFSEAERHRIAFFKEQVRGQSRGVIGYSTGCSELYPYKKFTVDRSIEVIQGWREKFPDMTIALLGGREDQQRNQQMKSAFPEDLVVETPTTNGLREGLMWMATSDLVLTGCSLGLHMAIALKKSVVTWFGVSCAQEIDLYDRGIKLKSHVSCSPCWKKACDQEVKCFDQVRVEDIMEGTSRLLEQEGLLGDH